MAWARSEAPRVRLSIAIRYLLDYGGVFEPLRNLEYFRQLRADPEAGTIVWPNDADIAPETLYARTQRVDRVRTLT